MKSILRCLNFFKLSFAPPSRPAHSREAIMLLNAADAIRKYGWSRGGQGYLARGLCILEAISLVQNSADFGWQSAIVPPALLAAVFEKIPSAFITVVDYNDNYCQSGNDAIEILERAAVIADQKMLVLDYV